MRSRLRQCHAVTSQVAFVAIGVGVEYGIRGRVPGAGAAGSIGYAVVRTVRAYRGPAGLKRQQDQQEDKEQSAHY